MSSAPTTPPAGWYKNPEDESQWRYWDGSKWTDNTSPIQAGAAAPSAQPPAATPAASPSDKKIGFFGARKAAENLQEQLDVANASLQKLGGMEHAQVEQAIRDQRKVLEGLQGQYQQVQAQLAELQTQIVKTQEEQILQEVGIYEYRHPLTDSARFQQQLKLLQQQIKDMAKADGGAVVGELEWSVGGSDAQGRRMVRETCKLMLRAYNAEADNLVRSMKPYKLDAASSRLVKVAETIQRLGQTLGIHISPEYQRLRLEELALTADFLAMKAEEKEKEREEKERLREQAKLEKEIARERERLEKEQSHYQNALKKLEDKGDAEGAARMREQLGEIEKAIEDVDYREANIRAGYIYVVSNIGAFGEDVVKVGLTRRLDPNDRVRELGDASVPFRYDTHALIFTDDAVGVEQELHKRLDDKRINRVNLRREFFRVTPAEVKEHLKELDVELLEFTDEPEALEFRQSLTMARQAGEEAAVAPKVVDSPE